MNRWDERDEPRGWGEVDADQAALFDAVVDGMPALVTYAAAYEGVYEPTTDEVLELLADADRAARELDDVDKLLAVLDGTARLRRQLAAVPTYLAAA